MDWRPEVQKDVKIEEFTYSRSRDPSIGTTVSLRGVQLATGITGKVSALKPDILVLGGPCSECTQRSILPALKEAVSYGKVLLVYSSEPQPLPAEIASVKAAVTVVFDPSGRLETELSAVWTPRFYRFRDGKLQALQGPGEGVEAFLRRSK
jgi:hypothetical protein